MSLGLGSLAPATFPGLTEANQQWRWQEQRRAGELLAASASAGQAEPRSVVWTGLCVWMGEHACECAMLGCISPRMLFGKNSNLNNKHLNTLHLDSTIAFATLVFSLFAFCVSFYLPIISLSFSIILSVTF